MTFRPITDVWILARTKVKYHGAYPAGFLHRARALLGIRLQDPLLHVCAGHVRDYPYSGFGPADKTLDLDPACAPDYLQDAREPLPSAPPPLEWWPAVLIDRPYTPSDAAQYAPGVDVLPEINVLLKNALAVVAVGARVGVLDYQWPNPPKEGREVAVVAVGTGRNARARWYTVFERLKESEARSVYIACRESRDSRDRPTQRSLNLGHRGKDFC